MPVELFISAFVTFFVIIDPPGCAPIFASLTDGTSVQHKRSMAYRSVMVATGIVLLFAFLGEPLLSALGISLDAFRVAGGIMLFMIAIDMVFEKRTERRENRAEQVKEGATQPLEHEDISVFPMGIPMIAGPGTIASVMLLMSESRDNWEEQAAVLLALGLILLMTLAALLAAGPIMRVLGRTVAAMITRLLGVILAALAAQFVFDAITNVFVTG